MTSESRLRAATDILIQSPDFCGGGSDRAQRVQSAYALAGRLAHVLRDDDALGQTFTAVAWEVFDDWCAHLEDAIGSDFDSIPPSVKAAIFHETDMVEQGIEKARAWLAGHRD